MDSVRARWRRWGGRLAGGLLTAGAAAFASWAAGDAVSASVRAALSGYAPTYAQELTKMGHADLPVRVAEDDAAYVEMLAAERRWETANPRVRDIWTLRKADDDHAVHLVDAESDFNQNGAIDTGWEHRVPPGVVDAGPLGEALRAAFRGEAGVDLTVQTDARGEVVEAYAPLRGPDGRVEAVVGVAFDAHPIVLLLTAARVGAGALVAALGVVAGLVAQLRVVRGEAWQRLAEAALTRDEAVRAQAGAVEASTRAAARIHGLLDRLPGLAALRHGTRVHVNPRLAAVLGGPTATVDEFFATAWGPHAAAARTFYEADRAARFPEPRSLPLGTRPGLTTWLVADDGDTELWLFLDPIPAAVEPAAAPDAAAVDELVDAGFAVWDAEDRLLHCNERFRALWGDVAADVVPGVAHDALLAAFARSGGHWPSGLGEDAWMEGRRRVHRGEEAALEERVKSGWIAASARPLPDGRTVWLVVDITEQKRVQRELREARDAAQLAARTRTEFLANMSHEIRTPMTAILGYLDLLAEPETTEADRRAHVSTIRHNASHLLTILNDILDLSKIEAGQMTVERIEVDTAAIVDDVVSLLRPRADEKGLVLDVSCTSPVPARFASDPTRVRQILLNLLSNAVKFTPAGRVGLEVGCPPGAPGALQFRVVDTGIGMEPHQIDALFEPFTQADGSTTRRFGGTGLGLGISRRLATMLDGRIDVTSARGLGSTFTFTLQVEVADGAPTITSLAFVPPPAPAAVAPVTLTGRVLLAEDARDTVLLLTAHLRRAGAEVEVVHTGRRARDEALGAWRAGRPYGVVLMDMQMPELDGYDATRELRNEGYRGAIVALTAHAMPGDREKCLAAGCDGYLAKPIDRAELLATVSTLLDAPAEADDPVPDPADPVLADLTAAFLEDLPAHVAALFDRVAEADTAGAAATAQHIGRSATELRLPALARYARRVEEALGDPDRSVRLRMRLLDLGRAVAKMRTAIGVGRKAG